ncbi:MAG: hypothetical protein Q7J69_06165 [Candidatus Omnitrophota bacterium]|nr:hypothetical protein [Candidatus Omnitrophota bacterium]
MKSVEGLFQGGELRFGRREKTWLLVLVWVAAGLWGHRVFVQPRAEAARGAHEELREARQELARLEAQRPDIRVLEEQIRSLQKQVGNTYQQLEDLEKGLLYRQDVDLLLERLVADQKKLNLRINAVEPLKDSQAKEKNSFYKRLFVEVDASATFEQLIAYLNVLEGQGPYQRVHGAKVKMEKKEAGTEEANPRAVILVESLLADTSEHRSDQRKRVFSLMEDLSVREKKDPFMARERPREEKEALDMSLSGIFGAGGVLSALIDGEAHQEGDLVKGKRIVQILPDQVILEQGDQRYILRERETAGE